MPVEMLVKLLQHSNLLSQVTIKKTRKMCFIPAILECASQEELIKSLPPDTDSPSPIKITFEPRCVPVGVFCAMISRLVSKGSDGLLGMKWELIDSRVKRNLIAFRIFSAHITLVSHVDSFEIRVLRQNKAINTHDICSYVLSTILYVMKEINYRINPIIAFDCQCGEHESKDTDTLCLLLLDPFPYFQCQKMSPVILSPHQECWFAKVSLQH